MTPECVLAQVMIRGSSARSQSSPERTMLLFGQPVAPCMSLHRFGVMKT